MLVWSNQPFKRLWALGSCKDRNTFIAQAGHDSNSFFQLSKVNSFIDMARRTTSSIVMDIRRKFLSYVHFNIFFIKVILPLPLLLLVLEVDASLLVNRDFPKTNGAGHLFFHVCQN